MDVLGVKNYKIYMQFQNILLSNLIGHNYVVVKICFVLILILLWSVLYDIYGEVCYVIGIYV